MRRVSLIGVVLLTCSAPAQAALLTHPGHAILPAPLSPAKMTQSIRAYPHTLVELDHVRGSGIQFALLQAGGKVIAPELALWQLPSGAAERILPGLIAQHLVRSVTPDRPLRTTPASGFLDYFTDPLSSSEWWPSHIGADRWTPPPPGVPLTMIDSGVDLSHPEFAGRPNTLALNTQTFNANQDELHGTATASVAAAPQNGVGIVGLYPQANLQLWDASPDGALTVGSEIQGLHAAMKRGPSVINLSLGGFDRIPIEEQAIMEAFGNGSLIVASAGNDRAEGSALSYPASFPHVLTVGATNEADKVASFSSASPKMDLSAPGENMTVAVPTLWNASGYASYDGTSFSAPLVSAASAAIWTLRPTLTNTQLFEVMRRSARDVGQRGWNADTGYGVLDIPAALARKAPAPDQQEPNEDIYLVKPNGLFRSGHALLTAPGRPNRVLADHVEQADDPEDVFRTYLPAKGHLIVTVKPTANVDLEVWGRHTRTVYERGAAAKHDLLASSAHPGSRFERVTIRGRGVGQYIYVDVFLPKHVREASYTLSLATSPR